MLDNGDDALAMIRAGNIREGDVIVIRYEGPRGGPGMREMIDLTRTLGTLNLDDKIAMVTDGRFSGYSLGAVFGHVSPEAQSGGPIAIVQEGDMISYDIRKRTITLEVPDEEMAERMKAWKPKEIRQTGYLKKYSQVVSSASEGAVIPYR